MTYSTFLIDLDHTLLDSHQSEVAAFDQALKRCGIDAPSRFLPTYQAINGALWAAVERQELTPREVQATRFHRLVEQTDLDVDPTKLAADYVVGLGANGELYDGAIEALDRLATTSTLALVTNGLREVQRARIERLGLVHRFDAIVISDEVGHAKPGTEIFDIAFSLLGSPEKSTAVMVGDSLSSDIRGGANFGIATCWYNPHRRERSPDDVVSHEISELTELISLAVQNP